MQHHRSMTPAPQQPSLQNPVTLGKVTDILWETAVASLVNTFLVLLFGSIAFGIVSGIFHDMVPSLPLGLSHSVSAEAEAASPHSSWQTSYQQRFVLVFAILFTVSAWARLSRHSVDPLTSRRAARVQRLGRRIAEGWFGLIVGNAFGAMIAAMVASWVQQFSFTQVVLHWLWSVIGVPIHGILERVDSSAGIDGWFSWYNANQLKFSFWVFYLAAICDDLGLPNLKTVARLVWRRVRGKHTCSCSENVTSPARDGNALPPA